MIRARAVAAAAGAWALIAHAPAAEAQMRLQDALARALAESPELQIAADDVAAARGREAQAGLYVANPVVTAEVANHTAPGEQQIDRMFSLAQEIEIGGQRALRVNAAHSDVAHAELLLGDRRRRVLAEVRRAFAAAVAAERRERLAAEASAVARRLVEATARREKSGDASALDGQLAALEAARAEQASATAATEKLRSIDRLAGAIGLPDGETIEVAEPGDDAPRLALTDERALVERALEARPDLAGARAEQSRLEGEAALVKRRGEVPNPVVRGYYRKELLDETVVGGEIAVPIPVLNRDQGTETALRSSAAAASAEVRRLEQVIPREVRLALAHERAARATWDRFRSDTLPNAATAAQLIERSYAQGYSALTDALAQRDRIVQLRQAAIAAWLDLQDAETEVLEAVGEDLS